MELGIRGAGWGTQRNYAFTFNLVNVHTAHVQQCHAITPAETPGFQVDLFGPDEFIHINLFRQVATHVQLHTYSYFPLHYIVF